MNPTTETTREQTLLWNGSAGQAWVNEQALLDRMFLPFELLLRDLVATAPANASVLDVGCGTGSTTLAYARALGPVSQTVGIDISEPMLEAARRRAEEENSSATFINANAETHAFSEGTFDKIVSRFGVMFFDDPVRAFANLRSAARIGAHLHCIAWRSPADNPFMTTAERAAAPLLANLPPRRPGAPGQFAFADGQYVHHSLTTSGWSEVSVRPLDVVCEFPEDRLVAYLTRLGPVGVALGQLEGAERDAVIGTIRAAFEPFVTGASVRFTAACWLLEARRSA